jgi:alpha-tubulin suppressor-like RCC1 family protein
MPVSIMDFPNSLKRKVIMKSVKIFSALFAGIVLMSFASPVLAGTYYTHYTNAGCQVTLILSTNRISAGGTLEYSVVASGYRSGYTTGGPSLTIPVEILLDGQKISALGAPWHPYGVTPVTSAITNLTEGSHTVTIQHTNAFEYYSEQVYSHSVYHDPLFGSSWYDYYYNVFHYRTVPCSDTEALNVFPAYALSANSGPYAGGNTITITNCNFGAVTNVFVGGVAAAIVGSGDNWVTITVPAFGSAAVKEIVIQTGTGDTTLAEAYTVNPAGVIGADQQVALAGGGYHSLGLQSDGSIVAWGYNGDGQTSVPSPNTNFVAVAAGWDHSLGLKSDGSIVAWGLNNYGQAAVPSSNTNFVAVATGLFHSLGLKSNGSIVAWGRNDYGQTAVPSSNTNFVAVAGGYAHSLGLKSDGSIVAWGLNDQSQTNVPSPNTNFVAIAAGGNYSLGLKADGSIVAWGWNGYGLTTVPSPNTNFVAVAAGYSHSLGLKSDGSIVAWGRSSEGQTNVPSPNTNFMAVAAGFDHSLGLKSDGSIVAWGLNGDGQTNVPSPNANFGLPSGVHPESGSWTGGYEVVISGSNLGNGSDITNVTICGASATIVSQSSTQIVVTAAAGLSGTGDVVVYSVSHGVTTKSAGFTYQKTDQTVTFPAIGDQIMTGTVGLSATASSGLPVSFSVFSGPASISDGTNLMFTGAGTVSVVAAQAGDAYWNAAPNVTNVFDAVLGSPVVEVGGNLAFGNITTGTTATATMTITNSGDATLTVTEITCPDGFSGAWSGTIAAGGSQDVTVTFTPVAAIEYSGTVTISSDATSGTNTISASGTGVSASAYEKAITGFKLTTANSGTLVNGPSWVTGRYGNALSLSNGKYVTVPAPVPDIFNITGDLTIALWVKPNSVTCSGADPGFDLVAKRTSNSATPYELYIGNGGSVHLNYWATHIQYPIFTATATITTGTWQHITVTRSFSGGNATVTFYINGVQAGSSTAATGPALGSSAPVWLSRGPYHAAYTSQGTYFGLMDEVQIYNRALSASEITQTFFNHISTITNRVGNWRLDENSGTAASDTIADGSINEGAKAVTVLVPGGTDVTALVPRITTSPLTTISPLSGVAQNFVNPVLYTVTAEDLTKQSYTVTVAVPNGLSDADGNKLPDLWELQHFGIAGVDPEAICPNGINTVREAYIAGLNPNDPQSAFLTSILPDRILQWDAVSGRVYNVYWTTNLMSGFQCLESNIPWTRGSFTNATTVPCGYYKIDVRLEE